MTNRFFTLPTLDLNSRHLDRSFSFSGEQYFAYCSDLDRKLLELEHRTTIDQSLEPESSATAPLGDSREAHVAEPDPPSFDEAGFELDFEIDARWI